jgi:hypothetical protein
MNALRIVEKEGFRSLLEGLVGKLKVKKRTFFTEKLKRDFSNSKTALCLALENATDVCTTADMWTAHRRSYIGMTAHWKGEDLKRRSACLAIRRVKDRHTFDVIAKIINDIHKEFNIVDKVNVMITDSGSNFLKAFKVFGGNELTEDQDNLQNYEDGDCEDDDDVVFIDLDEIFQEHRAQEQEQTVENEDADSETENECRERIKLPYHVKCPCHLLNLIATTDISKITNVTFNKLKKQVDRKLQKIWNKQSRSSLASDTIKEKLGSLFILYNQTRWNSFYDAMNCVLKFSNTKSTELAETFRHFGLSSLTQLEKEFIGEYVRIMEPFTQALDVLQNEENMSIGCVIPTIKLLVEKMEEFSVDPTIHHCGSLVFAVLGGLHARFDHLMNERHLIMASISDPMFKMIWAEDNSKAEYTLLLKGAVRRVKTSQPT